MQMMWFRCEYCQHRFTSLDSKIYKFCPVCGHLVIGKKLVFEVKKDGTV